MPVPSWTEAERLKAIASYDILDAPEERDIDDISSLASEICNTPIALISIVTGGRQWFKAKVGLDIRETPLDEAICKYAIRQRDVFVVPDLSKDARFKDNPLVSGEPHITFYAGVPLETPEGLPIGTLCVLDFKPRDLTEKQAFALKALSRQVMIQLELRRSLKAKSRSEELPGASELNYRRLFEAAQDGVLILDVEEGRITDVNPFLVNLLGYSRDEMVGKTVGELSPFEDAFSNQAILEQLQENGYVRYEDLPLETRDGRHIAVEFVSNVYQAGDKKVIQCNIRDNTERKKSEQQMALLYTCVSHLKDAILVTDAVSISEPGPKIVFVNEAFERISGYTRDEAVGRSPRFLQGPNTDRHTLAEIHAALVERKPIRRQLINYKKDGTEYWMDIDIVPIFDSSGECTHFAGIQRDITEQICAENKIRFNEQRYRSLVEATAAIVWDTPASGEFEADQPGWSAFTGQSFEELRGWGWLNAVHPDDQAETKRIWAAAIAERSVYKVEHRLKAKDKSYHDMVVRAVPILSEDGSILQWIGIHTDITERKKLEQQFLRAQRMESIGTLAGGIAHDLNNILAPIMMSIDILKLSATDAQTQAILETIATSSRRGRDIVRQVLSFARGMEGDRMVVQPSHLLKDMETIIKDTFPKNIHLALSLPDGSCGVICDPTQLHQILLNLCVNARDAMPDGGTLTIAVENSVLDEQYAAMHFEAKAGRYVVLSVTDTGQGMSPSIMDKIFDPFFTTKELGKGTGLGLSTVRAIVKSHGGFMNVYSEPGRGTTFKVYLPAMEASPEGRKDEAEESRMPRGNGETILIVDDEASILTVTSKTLEAFGYRTLTANDGAEAIALYAEKRDKIAVVLTDMAMPIMDGTATIRALLKLNPEIKIVAASGLNANNGESKTFGTAIKHFLTKPYTAGTMLKVMREILTEA